MKKFYLLLFIASLSLSTVAQESFELGKPNNDNYRYLDNLKALKEYIDQDKYPNFKLGIGTTVNDYFSNQTFRNLVNKNFTETVAGNAMKMGSVVDGNGNMNFTTVKNYVTTATDAGLNVYGHVLAWHSQQPINWLTSLVNGKTAEERKEAMIGAMEKWIKGMMEACDGKVKAWDMVNEAIANEGDDGEKNFPLQHSNGYKGGSWDVGGQNFYWQDHLGDIDYVRVVHRLARKYGPKDMKLFINDYNLESEWDDNKKLQSLINWITKWEADGETKIDGIGTQMHINCFENSTFQNNVKSHITQMFQLMVATGKLVRVSELDMGYVRGSNRWASPVKTSQMTENEHKAMADFYEWIIKEYLRIVPAEQQWGICQWCPTDAPDTQYMWRRNEPVGIWDINYYRKHAYAGFVKGLGGNVDTGIENTKTSIDNSFDTSKGIYTINGTHMQTTDLNELPRGIYIINNKKLVVK